MKKLFLLLLLSIVLCNCKEQKQNILWLNDYEVLKQEMVENYSNLRDASFKENISLAELNQFTKSELVKASDKKEAQKIFKDFLKKFKDGHLRARVFEISSESAEVVDDALKSSDPDSIALKKMTYENRGPRFRVQYDSILGFQPMQKEDNPFYAAIIKKENQKIGILKIDAFGYFGYWKSAISLWNSYRKTFNGECDSDCEWEFKKLHEKQLTEKLIERIDELKKKKISSLVLDVSGNVGGTEWYEAVARLFTDGVLQGSKTFFIGNKIWDDNLQSHLDFIKSDLKNPNISGGLKEKLTKFKGLIESLKQNIEKKCDYNQVWNNDRMDCLNLIAHPYNTELPFDIMKDDDFLFLESRQIISSYKFLPYQKGIYSGPLFIVQDRYSVSATEGFNSLLQLNDKAIIVGENSYGAGCGYTNGGVNIQLKNVGLSVIMPDCIRLRKDGKSEIYGVEPDIKMDWNKNDSKYDKGSMIINSIIDYIKSN